MITQRGGLLDLWNGGANAVLMCSFWGGRNYLVSEISSSQMCYLWYDIWGRRDYLGSDISSIYIVQAKSKLDSSLFGIFEKVGLIIRGPEKVACDIGTPVR